jgi:small GTP-binding protein
LPPLRFHPRGYKTSYFCHFYSQHAHLQPLQQEQQEQQEDMTFDSLTDFQIKVALIGYVSVGKTTILNALLRDKYGEVAMGRATASVNYYCCTSKPQQRVSSAPSSVKSSSLPFAWSASGLPQPAAEIHRQTVRDNARLRHTATVEERWFDVELEQDLCLMRDDAKLVVVDIPGINEAGTSSKYKDYIAKHWHSFECVVVVMDGRQGVNTEEQVELLQLAKSNCDRIKNVPVIVLFNKIDDPDDKEQSVLIHEARQVVQKVFGTEDQVKTLHDVLATSGFNRDRGIFQKPFYCPSRQSMHSSTKLGLALTMSSSSALMTKWSKSSERISLVEHGAIGVRSRRLQRHLK